jgi:hypothetical protein
MAVLSNSLFTDGVGIAHPDILQMAAEILGKNRGCDAAPSAAQVRLCLLLTNLIPFICER